MTKIGTTLAVAASLVAFTGCNKKKEEATAQKPTETDVAPRAPEPSKEQVKTLSGADLAEKYKLCTGLINAGTWDQFQKDCVAESYTSHSFGGTPELKGPAALVDYFKTMKTGFPDWKLEPQLIVVSGRNILAIDLTTGTNTGPMKTPMGEMPATNKKTGQLMFHRLKLDDANRATDEWAIVDPTTLLGQLGLAPPGSPPVRPVMDKGLEGAPMLVVTADDAKEKANLETVQKSNDAFNAHKVADMMATLTDDAVESDQASPADVVGKKAIEKGVTAFFAGFPDGKITGTEMWAGGDYVVQIAKFEGTNTGDMGAMKKTGKKASVDIVEVMHFKDGKIDHLWRFRNVFQMAIQLGLVPSPPAAPAAGSAATMAPAEPKK